MIGDPTQRFSGRVDNYVKFRPDYPAAVIDVLRARCGLSADTDVADVGSGTGIFTRQLLGYARRVYAVEPNAGMRAAAESALASFPGLRSVQGTAEATSLSDHCVGLVTAAQAFHWFDRARARAEFARVLEPGGWLALVWNDRLLDGTLFLREYEALLRKFGTDYLEVRDRHLDLAQVRDFVGRGEVSLTVIPHRQLLNYEGLAGRLMSSSYAPAPQDDAYDRTLDALRAIFDRCQVDGVISFDYETQVYCGQIAV